MSSIIEEQGGGVNGHVIIRPSLPNYGGFVGRVINPDGVGKERKRFVRAIAILPEAQAALARKMMKDISSTVVDG